MFKTPDNLFTVGGGAPLGPTSSSAATTTSTESSQHFSTVTFTGADAEAENTSTGQSAEIEPLQTVRPALGFVNPPLLVNTEEKTPVKSESDEKSEVEESKEEDKSTAEEAESGTIVTTEKPKSPEKETVGESALIEEDPFARGEKEHKLVESADGQTTPTPITVQPGTVT